MKPSLRMLAGVCLSGLLTLAASGANAGQIKIYFDRQVKNLTEAADENAAAAVQQAVAANATQIDIVGHADTAEKHGQALSLARAKAVKAAMLRHKLPKTIKVTTKGVGATQPDVPIGPNTSEPIDRFVSVTF